MKTKVWGGKRKGAGRKKGRQTVVLSLRVPTELKEKIKAIIKDYIKENSQ